MLIYKYVGRGLALAVEKDGFIPPPPAVVPLPLGKGGYIERIYF